MGNVYIYEADAEDVSTLGLCGALTPSSCVFHEVANGMSSVKLEHPLDEQGRYTQLRENRILKCDVPVRTTPEIAGGAFVTVIEQYKLLSTARGADRYIYNKANPQAKGQKKLKRATPGDVISIIATYDEEVYPGYRWKCKYTWRELRRVRGRRQWVNRTVTGYIAHDSTVLERFETVTVPDASTGIEAVAPSWRIEEQLFRITSVERSEKAVLVEASHITYDLMYNLTGYEQNGTRTLQQAADEMLAACFDAHQFTFQTNIQGEKTGFHFRDKDPITALLDPDIGLVSRWNGELIRDNYGFTVLDHAGVNRGVMFTYGKNIEGVSVSLDYANVATAIRPVGETEAGKPVYLAHSWLWQGVDGEGKDILTELSDTAGIVYGRCHALENGVITCRLPHARIFPLDGEDCKENKKEGVPIWLVQRRLLEQSVAKLKDGAEDPEVSVDVDMQLLGHTQQWSIYRELEPVFLFDTVRVRHPGLGIDLETPVSEIEWDCIEDTPMTIGTGAIHDLTASVASWQVSSLNGAKLLPGSVSSSQMADGCIITEALQAGSVTTDKLAAGAVTADKIAGKTITAAQLAAKLITADSGLIDTGAIDTASLADASVTAVKLAADAVETAKIADDAVTTAKLDDEAVTTAKIGDGAVTLAKLDAGAIRPGFYSFSTNYSYSAANIATYGAPGYTGSWVCGDTTGVQVGDTAMLRLTNSTTGGDAFIVAQVLQVESATRLRLQSVGAVV